MIITIDGPAGSGKSTHARRLATDLGVAYLDTGATYRAVTLKALREAIDLDDDPAKRRLAATADIELIPKPDGLRVLLDDQDVSDEIRTIEVTENAHHFASSPGVRAVLVELQRRIGRELGSFVTEGRDQGTVVFPDADVKFFLDADPAERARRRLDQIRQAGQHATFEEVLEAIRLRDQRDRNRQVGPLVQPEDAVVVDTSGRSVEDVCNEMLQHVERQQ